MKIAITPIAAALALAFTTAPLVAQEPAPGIIGKNGWLYYNHEFLEDAPGAAKAIDLVGRINKQLVANGTQVLLMSRLDNLGKGASGAAVQSMNVHLGVDEGLGL